MNIKLDGRFFDELLVEAGESPRKRSHRNIHQSLDEPVQRLCIGLRKGTYVRPHHHPNPYRWEMMLVLRGTVGLVLFDKDGVVSERLTLDPGGSLMGAELAPGTWHTLFPLTDEAVILEVKQGPFTPTASSDFAGWAPEEGDTEAEAFLAWVEAALPGERFTA